MNGLSVSTSSKSIFERANARLKSPRRLELMSAYAFLTDGFPVLSDIISPVSLSSRVMTPSSGRDVSRGSIISKQTKSWRLFVMSRALNTSDFDFSAGLGIFPSGPCRKSEISTTIALRFKMRFTSSSAAAISVPRCFGSKTRTSRISRSMCWRPLRGGIYCKLIFI